MDSTRTNRSCLLLALAGALTVAGIQYALFLPHSQELWTNAAHDRNAHYFVGLSLALDVRNGDLVTLAHDLDKERIWPPLHAILLASVLNVTGYDPAFAVLPSLCAWAGLLVGVFVLARRIAPMGGNVAGFAAMLCLLASPTHRAFATDVMLESLGVCLSVWALERYVALRQSPSGATGRALGVVLTLLFLTKFNYWVLVVAGLVTTELLTRPGLVTLLRQLPLGWLRDPMVLLALLVGSLAALLAFVPMQVGPLRLAHGGGLASVAVLLLLVRVVLWRYRGPGREVWPTYPAAARGVVAWGVVPVAVWFALPGRLAAFLWLGLSAHGEYPDYSLTSRATRLLGWLTTDYHDPLVLAGVVALALVAVSALRSLRPGAAVVVIFLAVAALLTLKHPNCKARFLMNWLPALWVLAGVGVGLLARWRYVAPAALALLAVLCVPAALVPGLAPEAGPRPGAPSLVTLAEAYLPHVAAGERTAVLSTMPMKFFTQWSYLQTFRPARDRDLEGRIWLPLETANLADFSASLERTRCDAVVVLELAPSSPFAGEVPGWTGDAVLARWRDTQQQFTARTTQVVPVLGATIRVYQRNTLAQR